MKTLIETILISAALAGYSLAAHAASTIYQYKDNQSNTFNVLLWSVCGGSTQFCTGMVLEDTGGNALTTAPGTGNSSSALPIQGVSGGVAVPVSAASLPLPTGAATSALQGTNSATTSHTCSTAGFSELGCLGQIDDDVKGPTTTFSAVSAASVTRPANTTTYTANTGWCGATAACATVFSFTGACRVNGGQVLIPEIDIWSSANPTLKLQGILWLFNATPGTIINDDATFNIASADFANLTGNMAGFPFTLTAPQASGAANSSVSLTGTTYHAQCPGGSTTLTGMVQVVNAYVPANAEVLHATLHTVGLN